MALFGRRVILEIGPEGQEGRTFEGMRVRFQVDMTDSSNPNKAKVTLYNPSPTSAALAQDPNAVIRLSVGYEPDVPRLIFQGDPIDGGVTLMRQGPDRILTIEAQDGGRVWRESYIDVALDAEATTTLDLLDQVKEAMGIAAGSLELGEDLSLASGVSLSGTAREILDRITSMTGSLWGIRDGTLVVWPEGQTTQEEAVVFSVETGNLIGAPTVKDDGVEIRALIATSMRPGKAFRVQSEYVSGDYVADSVSFRGDSGFSTDFYCIVTGSPL